MGTLTKGRVLEEVGRASWSGSIRMTNKSWSYGEAVEWEEG